MQNKLRITLIMVALLVIMSMMYNKIQHITEYSSYKFDGYGKPTKIEVNDSTVKNSSDSTDGYQVSGFVDGKEFSEQLAGGDLPVTKNKTTILFKYNGYKDVSNGKPVYYGKSQGNLMKYYK